MSRQAAERCRIDVWLWRARLFKTRALAATVVEQGGVRLSRAGASRVIDKPSYALSVGDGLTVRQAGRLITLQVLAFGVRRGPAAEARSLYQRFETHGGSDDGPDAPAQPRDDADA
jgi:ribosome-associated heat shock protein Hsp15